MPALTADQIRADPGRHGHYGGRNKNGSPCGGTVVAGTKTCRMHGGKSLVKLRAEGQIRIELSKWMLDGHDGSHIDLAGVLLQLVAFWRHKFNQYGRLLGEAYDAAERLRAAHHAGDLLTTPAGFEVDDDGVPMFEDPAVQVARADLDRIFTTGGLAALIGYKYDADRNGHVYPVEEAVRGLQRLHDEASDRLAKYVALAIDKGIDERRIRLAEREGALMAQFVTAVAERLGLTLEQQAALPGAIEAEVINMTEGAAG